MTERENQAAAELSEIVRRAQAGEITWDEAVTLGMPSAEIINEERGEAILARDGRPSADDRGEVLDDDQGEGKWLARFERLAMGDPLICQSVVMGLIGAVRHYARSARIE